LLDTILCHFVKEKYIGIINYDKSCNLKKTNKIDRAVKMVKIAKLKKNVNYKILDRKYWMKQMSNKWDETSVGEWDSSTKLATA